MITEDRGELLTSIARKLLPVLSDVGLNTFDADEPVDDSPLDVLHIYHRLEPLFEWVGDAIATDPTWKGSFTYDGIRLQRDGDLKNGFELSISVVVWSQETKTS